MWITKVIKDFFISAICAIYLIFLCVGVPWILLIVVEWFSTPTTDESALANRVAVFQQHQRCEQAIKQDNTRAHITHATVGSILVADPFEDQMPWAIVLSLDGPGCGWGCDCSLSIEQLNYWDYPRYWGNFQREIQRVSVEYTPTASYYDVKYNTYMYHTWRIASPNDLDRIQLEFDYHFRNEKPPPEIAACNPAIYRKGPS